MSADVLAVLFAVAAGGLMMAAVGWVLYRGLFAGGPPKKRLTP